MVYSQTKSSLKGKNLDLSIGEFSIFEGSGHPFGATVSNDGVNFSVYSQNATSVELLIFKTPDDLDPITSIKLDPIDNRSFYIWNPRYIRQLRYRSASSLMNQMDCYHHAPTDNKRARLNPLADHFLPWY